RRRDVADAHELARDVPDAFGVRAVAVRCERMRAAIAAAALLDVADERSDRVRHGARARRLEERRLRSFEVERQREIESAAHVRDPLPAACGDVELYAHLRLASRSGAICPQRLHWRFAGFE